MLLQQDYRKTKNVKFYYEVTFFADGQPLLTMTELEQYISTYFGVVRSNELHAISSLFRRSTIRKGEYLLRSGQQCHYLGFVESGILRVFASTAEKDVTQWISTQGYFVTDLASFVFRSPARWNIQALADSEIYAINREEYQKIGATVTGWHELEKLFIARCFTMLEDRIFSHLSLSAEERYQRFFEAQPELFLQVPLQYIASMLGMTPETFSRIRKKQLL
jgi:CRP/FNR family transcriptional regulator, anaerobic regulatory protein